MVKIPWDVDKSSELYGVKFWGNGYFYVNKQGHVCVCAEKNQRERSVDLYELAQDLVERGIRLPLLVRFPNILHDRVQTIANCFASAIDSYGYKGHYQGVYPIKVNQQRHLVEELVRHGENYQMGLECGSKPELLVALAMMKNSGLIICNGFKDSEYIETALLSRKLGKNTLIVVDRLIELPQIISAARKLNTPPVIGFRAKLDTKGAGKWVESSGSGSKFGLTPSEIVEGIRILKEAGQMEALQLLHFHIGSQITSIQAIKSSLREGIRFFTELHAMGAQLKYIDVGGGLGVDYDGTGTSHSSINYTEQEYANDVVSVIQDLCDQKEIPHPTIISESGRALVAHHSLLIFDVLDTTQISSTTAPPRPSSDDHQVIQDLYEMLQNLSADNLNETYNDSQQFKDDLVQLFKYGVLSLEERAKAETIFWILQERIDQLAPDVEDAEIFREKLKQSLSDTYFCNFSVFQSVPDSWAVDQIFPVMPIHRLDEKPERRAVLTDLTCDSDGKIDKFIEHATDEVVRTLEVHSIQPGDEYFIGVFLVGAYQEILGDLHNLFGDTDAVHVTINEGGFSVDHFVEGDTVTEVLSYVQYNRNELMESIRRSCEQSILERRISKQDAKLLLRHYEIGLAGYTYLEDPEK